MKKTLVDWLFAHGYQPLPYELSAHLAEIGTAANDVVDTLVTLGYGWLQDVPGIRTTIFAGKPCQAARWPSVN